MSAITLKLAAALLGVPVSGCLFVYFLLTWADAASARAFGAENAGPSWGALWMGFYVLSFALAILTD